jgi:hypothetical protein
VQDAPAPPQPFPERLGLFFFDGHAKLGTEFSWRSCVGAHTKHQPCSVHGQQLGLALTGLLYFDHCTTRDVGDLVLPKQPAPRPSGAIFT